jgi:hypothetical protein
MAPLIAMSVFSGIGPELPLWATVWVQGGVTYGMGIFPAERRFPIFE